jgi:hypothetical protein
MFALGCIIYEVVTCRKLFASDFAVWEHAMKKDPLLLRIWPDCVVGSPFHGLGRLADELVEIEVLKRPGAAEVTRKLEMIKATDPRGNQSLDLSKDLEGNAPETTDEIAALAPAGDQATQPFEAVFTPLYANSSGSGIGGYDMRDRNDRAFGFDYLHSGTPDHLVLYRPGTGTLWILRNNSGTFQPVYQEGCPGHGIGGYDLASPIDRVFAFDYEHSGKLDHLVLHRRGTGTIWILRNEEGEFTPVYQEGCPGEGIGGHDLKDPTDRIFAFDFEHSGNMDHFVLYRPGAGTMMIIGNNNGIFTSVYSGTVSGVGAFETPSDIDRAFAFDYSRTGKSDHILLYRRGKGCLCILQNQDGLFTAVYSQNDLNGGLSLHPLSFNRIFSYDYEGTGKANHLVLYGPQTGHLEIVRNEGDTFKDVYGASDKNPGRGIGGYDLLSPYDRIFPFAYFSRGKASQLCLYRPGEGTFWILRRF